MSNRIYARQFNVGPTTAEERDWLPDDDDRIATFAFSGEPCCAYTHHIPMSRNEAIALRDALNEWLAAEVRQ